MRTFVFVSIVSKPPGRHRVSWPNESKWELSRPSSGLKSSAGAGEAGILRRVQSGATAYRPFRPHMIHRQCRPLFETVPAGEPALDCSLGGLLSIERTEPLGARRVLSHIAISRRVPEAAGPPPQAASAEKCYRTTVKCYRTTVRRWVRVCPSPEAARSTFPPGELLIATLPPYVSISDVLHDDVLHDGEYSREGPVRRAVVRRCSRRHAGGTRPDSTDSGSKRSFPCNESL